MGLETEQGNDVVGDSEEPATTTTEQPETATENGAAQPQGTPQYVTVDQFQALNKTIEGFGTTLQTVQRALHAPPASPQQVAAEVEEPSYEPTEEDLTEAFTSAKLRPTLSKYIASEVRKETRELRRELGEVRATGTHAIASLTAQAARPEMPYYDRFKGEIDEYVKTLDGTARMNPHAYRLAHDAVVGRHARDLIDEAKREAVRSARANDVALPGGGRGPAKAGAPVPDVEEAAALEALNMTPDEFARKQGYDSWEERSKALAKYTRKAARK